MKLAAAMSCAGVLLAAAAPFARDPGADDADSALFPVADARVGALHRLPSAVLPPDGLLLVELGGEWGMVDLPEPAGAFVEGDLYAVRLGLEYGALTWLRLQAAVPWRAWSAPDGYLPPGGGGLGDANLGATVALPSPWRALALAARVGATLPTGASRPGYGETEAAPEAAVAAAVRLWRASDFPELRLHLSLGRRWNPDGGRGAVPDVDGLSPEGLYEPWPPLYPAVAPDGDPGDNDWLILGGAAELRAAATTLYLEFTEARLPLGHGAAVREFPRFLTPGLHWGGAQGWGLSASCDVSLSRDAPDTPFVPVLPDLTYRLALSRALPVGGRDRDRDGVPDRGDACPDTPEDRDGWRDRDGCPDADNDGDGVPDALDGAPDRSEDRDGWEDEDGIPDPDNDGDAIPDALDACPNAAEDRDGDRDGDGCPEQRIDSDGDGVADDQDRCPTLAEDSDGFEDGDGCPDPDNDLDGIDDARDRCPGEAEDYDGVSDDDGCPDASVSAPPDTSGAR